MNPLFTNPRAWLRAGLLTLASIAASTAQAALVFDARISTYFISFSDARFASANARYDVHGDVSGIDGESSLALQTAIRTGQSNFSWSAGSYRNSGNPADSHLTVSNVVNPGNTGLAYADLALSGGTRGGFDFGYDTAAGALGASFIQRNIGPGGYSLDFSGGGNGFLAQGGLFSLIVFVQGNWSQTGTGPGQLEFLALNPAFTPVVDWAYDANLNATVFSASGVSPDGLGSFGPGLQFRLHGNAIQALPEPATLGLVLGGLLLIAARRRA